MHAWLFSCDESHRRASVTTLTILINHDVLLLIWQILLACRASSKAHMQVPFKRVDSLNSMMTFYAVVFLTKYCYQSMQGTELSVITAITTNCWSLWTKRLISLGLWLDFFFCFCLLFLQIPSVEGKGNLFEQIICEHQVKGPLPQLDLYLVYVVSPLVL